ncbi:MAG: branched-subunit amino acid aminotransferase/4-amino-4-deoxychorismate lyase [Bacteroidia bacterium]|jgi:branched-subunit amino acid aminotransferase/4-amino-4-deoxychorismate lyase
MSQFQLFNGVFHPTDEALLSVNNRGFTYGDGFFESMRVSNGKAPLINGHWQRLERVTSFMRISIAPELNLRSFNQFALQLAGKNGYSNARIRFQGYRIGAGKYTPEESKLGWCMICEPNEESYYSLNKKGLRLDVCKSHVINPAPQSSFKTSNSLPYVLGGIYAKENGLDDCFLIDGKGNVAEATGSNVFLVKENMLITPDLVSGGVGGVMRSLVMQEASAVGLSVNAKTITREDILNADECFLTNASTGIQWVGAVGKKRYFKRAASKLTEHINAKFDLVN